MPDRNSTGRRDNDEPGLTGSIPERVDRDELLALAEVDAFGVIDPVEAVRLERLFANATPSLQAEVRAMQERLAMNPALRSAETPGESLRLRTLGRVAQAIEQEASGAAPIATIGPKAGQAIATGSARAAPREEWDTESFRSMVHAIERERARQILPRHPYWRFAALIMLGALCVSLYFNYRFVTVSEKLAGLANAEIFDSDLRAIARDLAGFDFARARHVDLMRLVPERGGHVSIFSDPATGRIAVIGVGFEVDEVLEIVVRNPEGGAPVTREFRVAASGFGKVCDVPEALARAGLVEIRDASGVTLFKA